MRTGLVVLIAENDRDMRGYVRRCVEKHDMQIAEILEARDGAEALQLARSREVDLIITDGAMPRLDGFALCTALRSARPGNRIAILVITGAYDLHDATRRAQAAGADGLLLKPFNARSLCDKIDEVLRSRAPAERADAADEETREEIGREERDEDENAR